jgi:hypothetical protein
MSQLNVLVYDSRIKIKSKNSRPIQRIQQQKDSDVVWEWCDDYGFFNPFEQDDNSTIEGDYQKDPNGSTDLQIHGNVYKFDFKDMLQINTLVNYSLLSYRVVKKEKSTEIQLENQLHLILKSLKIFFLPSLKRNKKT